MTWAPGDAVATVIGLAIFSLGGALLDWLARPVD